MSGATPAMTTTAAPATIAAVDPVVSPLSGILRDIARGGLTGALVGIVGAGIGGRIAMRVAALLVPEATGDFTSNGFRIGAITFDGTVGLLLTGMVVGLLAATVWVVVSPWIPDTGIRRAILAMPIAVGIGASGLIEAGNSDFFVLRNDARVVVALLLVVAIIGLLFGLVDDWLDRRLPRAVGPGSGATVAYAVLSLLGAVLILPFAVLGFLASKDPAMVLVGLGLVAVGVATLAWWRLRLRGQTVRPRNLTRAGRLLLLIAVVLGYVAVIPDIRYALGGS